MVIRYQSLRFGAARICAPLSEAKALLAQNSSSTDQIILPAVTAPSATAIVTVAQVVVIKLDRVQDIGEHAAVVGLVEARHAAIASRDTEGGVCDISIVRTSVVYSLISARMA
jgi:hypothetical protein